MAAQARPHTAAERLEALTDDALLARFRRGDDAALAVAVRRHERRLQAYARRILAGRSPNADDVVQEALLRTALVLRRGDRQLDLKPWLYRLVRNCALDELARARAEQIALDDVPELHAPFADPAEISAERVRMRDTLADVALLPDVQRHALLRREVDGATHAQVAEELGVSEPASRALVARARTTLVKARAGRDARCDDVRAGLLDAHDAGRRAPALAVRHLAACAACREFRSGLRRGRADLRALVPLPALLGAVVGAKAAGGLIALPGGSTAAKAGAVGAASVALAGGAIGLDRVFGPGDPAPVAVRSAVLPGGAVAPGDPLPPATAVVTRVVVAGAGPVGGRHPVRCPPGMRVAGLAPTAGDTSYAFAPETVVGSSTRAIVLTEPTGVRRRLTLAVVCKRPAADGSILAAPARATAASASGRRSAALCVDRAYLRTRPAGAVSGSLTRRQPLAVHEARDGWRRITADSGASGWVAERVLCRR